MPPCIVNLILGPAKSGKTERALARFSSKLDEWRCNPGGPSQVWIGPTPSVLSNVRDRLASLAAGAWLNPRITTFTTLAQEIVSQGSRRIRPVSNLEKQRILTHVIQRLVAEGRLKHFAAVASTPGFLRQVAAAIADLKRRDVWAEEVRKRSRTARDHDFALIYSAYQEHLGREQLFDMEGRFWAAREELEASLLRQRGEFRYGLVVLDGFADFTAAQHDLLRLLARHCQELLITLPDDAQAAGRKLLFDKPRRTLTQLEKSFPQLQREHTDKAHFQSTGLAVVEKNIFRDESLSPPPQYSGEELEEGNIGLFIVAANGVEGEIREIARRAKELLLSGRARPDDIAVVFPSLDEVAPRVATVFDDFGLPLALENRARLSTTPLIRAVTKLLRLVAEDWPFDLLLDVVGNHLLSLPSREEGLSAAAERCIRRAQLPAGRMLLLDQLREWANNSLPETDESVLSERVQQIREAQVASGALGELDSLLPQSTSRAALTERFAELELLLKRLDMTSGNNSTAWELFKKQFSLVVAIDTTLDVAAHDYSVVEFLNLIERVTAETLVPPASDDVGRVRVMAAESARNLSVKHLFLAGLSEQSYSSAEGPGALYREAEIQCFTDLGPVANLNEQQTGEAMLLFYDMVTRASESLTLSYAALDDKGQALIPSPYLTELERCFAPGAITTTAIPIGGTVDAEATPASRSEWRSLGMLAALEGKQHWLAGLQNSPATRELGRAILRSVESVASRSNRETFGPYEGLLLGPAARAAISKRFSASHLWSPSQLETYAECPYRFFAKQILRLEPLDDIALRSDHLRKGHLLHQVLAAIHSQQVEPGCSLDEGQLVERFTTELARIIRETPLQGLEDALREIERREIHSWAPLYSEQELAYRRRWDKLDEPLLPVYFEVRFGPKPRSGSTASDAVSTEVPFVLDLGSEQIKLTGQIDRIDMGRVGGVTVFNVIDYKSGQKVKLAREDITSGRQLQLPLYALAAENLLFVERKAVALATGYWSIQAGGFAGGRNALLEFRTHSDAGLADSPGWSEIETSIKQRVGEIVRGVRSAHFPIYSQDKDCTRSCDYSKICRVAQIRSLEKVWISDSIESNVNAKSET